MGVSNKKYLYILRHAKSDWSEEFKSDFERGLSKRGFRDILMVSKALKKKKIKPDLIISSSAIRAQTTAEIFGAILKYDIDDIIFKKSLYFASVGDIIKLIKDTSNDISHLAIVGHNPELTELVNVLSSLNLDNLPTSGFVALEFDVSNWQDIKKSNLLFYLTPKMLKSKKK